MCITQHENKHIQIHIKAAQNVGEIVNGEVKMLL